MRSLEGGEPEPLLLGRHQDGIRGVHPERHVRGPDAAEAEQLRIREGGRQRDRSIVALHLPARIRGEEQIGALRIEAEARPCLATLQGREPLDVDATRQDDDGSPATGTFPVAGEAVLVLLGDCYWAIRSNDSLETGSYRLPSRTSRSMWLSAAVQRASWRARGLTSVATSWLTRSARWSD